MNGKWLGKVGNGWDWLGNGRGWGGIEFMNPNRRLPIDIYKWSMNLEATSDQYICNILALFPVFGVYSWSPRWAASTGCSGRTTTSAG